MFETTVVEGRIDPNAHRRIALLPLSIGIHGAAIAAALLVTAWHVTLPKDSPQQVKPFLVAAQPSIPEEIRPTPPPPPRPAQAQPNQTAQVQTAPQSATPAITPDRIPDAIPIIGPMTTTVPQEFLRSPVLPGPSAGPVVSDAPIPDTTPGVIPAAVLVRVEPRYPELLIHVGLSGSATVQCIVDRSGQVQSVTPVRSTHKLFEEATIEAVKKWRFRAGILNGRTVATIFNLTVNFSLER
jgi:periplasmic protein TonB